MLLLCNDQEHYYIVQVLKDIFKLMNINLKNTVIYSIGMRYMDIEILTKV